MVGVDRNKLPKKEDAKEEVKSTAPKIVKRTGSTAPKVSTEGADDKIAAFKKMKAESKSAEELEMMHEKTHQDLINAAYKAADELKIAPWVLLRAAGWGHFTDDRGKKYDGPVVDELEGLDDDQKKALKKAIGL